MVVTYKGLTLQQSAYNNHYMIFDERGNPLLHANYSKPLTEFEAYRRIDEYLSYRKGGLNV